ncbi:hypothetical protein OGAPHI_004396 [Ogataea philodendri]|uniref:thioredoxin-dependent peroxiredoxin n=2 Tax=Saccharomycotina TaxID=147537 RepID=A0A9P8P7F8_9ASCO|nr:uncharacterized protein OGAPHI_004396 [Ogataea philodendri]KAH3666207.1 hypothetical protein OGAPHI_004396 [Ogataea philodendri]
MVRRSARLAGNTVEEAAPAAKKQKTTAQAVKPKQSTVDAKKESNDVKADTAKNTLEEGDEIPADLELENQDGESVNLLKLAKDAKVLVVFLYPKASTPGCTRQAVGFRDNFEVLTGLGATVVGLSSDSPKTQTNFKLKQKLSYDLLSDPSKKLIGPLGAKKQPNGIVRSDFIFRDGVLKVKRVGISPEKSFTGAVDEVKKLVT